MTAPEEFLTRRSFLAVAGALAASSLIPEARATPESAAAESGAPQSAATPPSPSPGEWQDDDLGLPCYGYTGPLRFASELRENGATLLPDDPYFLLGNYRLTLFTHASGLYQIITGERSWGRLNQGDPLPHKSGEARGDEKWSGSNRATVEVAGAKHELIGLHEPAAAAAEKHFGVGFARYDYAVSPSLKVTRLVSVAPSVKVNEGSSAFVVQVRLQNAGQDAQELSYRETTRAWYQPIYAVWSGDRDEVVYTPRAATHVGDNVVEVSFTAAARRRLAFPAKGQMSRLEQYPPSLFIKSLDANAHVVAEDDRESYPTIGVAYVVTLRPGEQREFSFIVGYSRDVSPPAIESVTAQLAGQAGLGRLRSAFGEAWKKVLPDFAAKKDSSLRREMRWNVAMLEAMSTWREYYDETIVPQGTVYDYLWGITASSRDLAQQALPLCHTNPAVARSTLRYIMKRTLPDGEIKLNDQGFGWVGSGAQQTSDQQLFFFMLLAEYLRVTRDGSVLTDQIEYYPRECSGRDTGLAHVRQAFLFLRDRIGVGPHGIVRRWNSDWNDMFFFWPTTMPYNRMFEAGESHMNSAMAIVILGELAGVIDAAFVALGGGALDGGAGELTAAMREYRAELNTAWMRDLGDRKFPRRAWTDYSTGLGQEEMWLEPQGFALQIPEFGVERKRELFAEVERRLLAGEAMGARQIEVPVTQPGTPPGSRENGGFWYALNGPLILGVATFDPAKAEQLLRLMTFANYVEIVPYYWTGRWAASDALDSALLRTNGLSENIPFCAHAHAWPLYCYLRLRSAERA